MPLARKTQRPFIAMQKPLNLTLCLFFFPLFVHSQNDVSSRQRVSLTVAPNIAYFFSKKAESQQLRHVGFHARLDGEWHLNSRFWLRIGVGWSWLRYKFTINNDGQGGYDPTLAIEYYHYRHPEKMISLPAALRYYFGRKQRLYTDLESGASLVFVQNSNDALRLTFGTAVGWQVPIYQHTWLFVQPTFRFILNNSFPARLKAYNQHPYSFGLEMGMRRGLR